MILYPLLLLLSAVAIVSAAPNSKRFLSRVTHEERSRIPTGWVQHTGALARRSDDAPVLDKRSFIIPLRIHLAQPNMDRAEELLMDVSHPASPNFGKHWTSKEVMDMFAPSAEAVRDVFEWLEDAGFERERVRYTKSTGSVVVKMTLEEAEELLHTSYELYIHPTSSRPHLACTSYSVPESIKHHIDMISPTLHFDIPLGTPRESHAPSPRHRRLSETKRDGSSPKSIGKGDNSGAFPVHLRTNKIVPSSLIPSLINQLEHCDTSITPVCLEALYKFSPATQVKSEENSFGIVEYTPQSYVPTDLDLFARNFTPKAVGYRPTLDSIDGGALVGGNASFDINGESNLDFTFAIALTYPTPITLYQTGDVPEGASFNNFLDAIDGSYCTFEGGDNASDGIYPDTQPGGYDAPQDCGKFKPTNVISTSYGYNEADLTPAYEQRQCYEYMKLGLMGVTVLYSSGDYGVAGNGGQCIIPATGEYGNGTDATRFNPSFPGGCPYITSVGATQVNPNSTVFEPESAAEQIIFSGGGFSNVFTMPSYQKTAVQNYFKNHKPSYTSEQYNNSMTARGFPDISANGVNYVVPIGGVWHNVFGTSCSSPVVGSIVTLLNDARLAVGKKPIGFLNPILYEYSSILNDITSGGNQGCGTPGFTAVSGWDPVTGLGTPNFPEMLAKFLELP